MKKKRGRFLIWFLIIGVLCLVLGFVLGVAYKSYIFGLQLAPITFPEIQRQTFWNTHVNAVCYPGTFQMKDVGGGCISIRSCREDGQWGSWGSPDCPPG